MRVALSAFIGSLIAGLVVVVIYGISQRRYAHQCPCNYIWSNSANGCVVDISNSNPCPDPGGGRNNPGGTGGGGRPPGSGVAPPPLPTGACHLVASPCDFTADFHNGTVGLWWTGGGSVAGQKVRLAIKTVEHSSGRTCTEIAGTVAFPGGTSTMNIPLDPTAAVAAYPSLTQSSKDNCVSGQFTIFAEPEDEPSCGCRITRIKG